MNDLALNAHIAGTSASGRELQASPDLHPALHGVKLPAVIEPGQILFGTTPEMKWKYLVTRGHSVYARLADLSRRKDLSGKRVIVGLAILGFTIFIANGMSLYLVSSAGQDPVRETRIPQAQIDGVAANKYVQSTGVGAPTADDLAELVQMDLEALNKTGKHKIKYFSKPTFGEVVLGPDGAGLRTPVLVGFKSDKARGWPARVWMVSFVQQENMTRSVLGMYYKDIDSEEWLFAQAASETVKIAGAKTIGNAEISPLIVHDLHGADPLSHTASSSFKY